MRSTARALAVALALGLTLPAIAASDAFKEIQELYEEVASNRDDEANLARRELYLQMYDHLHEKSCRKLLKNAYEEEVTTDNRVRVVEVLGACGESRDLNWLVGEFKREKSRGAVLVLGQALGYTDTSDPERMEEAVKFAAKHLKRAKDDLELALLEGLGNIPSPEAFAVLQKRGDEGPTQARFERAVGLGQSGGSEALADLDALSGASDPDVRLGAAIGLAAVGAPAEDRLIGLLGSEDPRVLEVAAAALADLGSKKAAPSLIEAMNGSPLRTVEELRKALRTITEQDHGHDAAAWKAAIVDGDKKARGAQPKFPEFFGIPVASDRVVIFLDMSTSMDRNGRLDEQTAGVTEFIEGLPDEVEFALYRVQGTPEPFRETWASGADDRSAAVTWIAESLTSRRFDFRAALLDALERFPTGDTFLVGTDSYPWGRGTIRAPRETIEIFRSANRMARVRMHCAYLTPGGPDETSDRDLREYDDRELIWQGMVDETDGQLVHIE